MSRRATSAAGPPRPRDEPAETTEAPREAPTEAAVEAPADSTVEAPTDPTATEPDLPAAGSEAETAGGEKPVADEPEAEPSYPVLAEPADGVPPVVESERDLLRAAEAIAAGTGPVAVDAERASGYRYGNRAYLVQLRRAGAGTWLIDPIAVPDLAPLQEAIGDTEWILHAATQDLPCLAEVGMRPAALFDTELGGRLAGLPRVGLSAVVEHYLGLSLAKEHSAVDWSTRPLPEPWLRYAALDVEVLAEVRDRLAADLAQQGKAELAAQEFDALTRFTGPPQRTDPWRRTSGMHRLRDRRALARVRELWQTRDDIARERDLAPGRVLPDALIVQLAASDPRTGEDLTALSSSGGVSQRGRRRPAHRSLARYQRQWLEAVRRADQLPQAQLPPSALRSDAPPPPRAWADREPVAAARLAVVRERLTEVSEQQQIPVENLLTPDSLRRVLWTPPDPADEGGFRAALTELGARPWQVDLVVPVLLDAVRDHPDEEPAS